PRPPTWGRTPRCAPTPRRCARRAGGRTSTRSKPPAEGPSVNQAHMEYCASDDWRRLVHETILPVALAGVALGDDALEIGPGPGFTTDILQTKTAHLTAVELDEGMAAGLAERLDGTNVSVCVGDATALAVEDARSP